MGEDRFEMSQKERDRLKVLTEAKKGLITQAQAASQLAISERQVRRLVRQLRARGDRAVVHGLRGRASNRRIESDAQSRAIAELSREECRDFGPTFGAEHVSKLLGQKVGRDTVRKWMIDAGLWQARKRKLQTVHQWRERRACFGELVQWDTSTHDWLEGRGERVYLIAMVDDATSRTWARFARHDNTEENMRVLWGWLERYGRPVAFYTDKAAMFEAAAKHSAAAEEYGADQTQITRALAELGIERISAHSPQAKGRIERFFHTAQDRLVKELRLAGVSTLESANAWLDSEFLPNWEKRFTVAPANHTDAHRSLTELHNLAASLSHVEERRIANDYTIQFHNQRYQIARGSTTVAMKGQKLRVEARLDGTLAVRFQGSYLDIFPCPAQTAAPTTPLPNYPTRKDHNRGGRSRWMQDYPAITPAPLWRAIRDSNHNC
jgi:biotin operon repressor